MFQLRDAATEPRYMSSAASFDGQWWTELIRLDAAALLNTILAKKNNKNASLCLINTVGSKLPYLPPPVT